MNVSLTPELERFVHGRVRTGRYNSASEVVREALRLLEDQEKVREARLREFRQEVDRRLASLDRGEGIDSGMVFDGLRERSETRRKKPA